jgi:hypothetical protein
MSHAVSPRRWPRRDTLWCKISTGVQRLESWVVGIFVTLSVALLGAVGAVLGRQVSIMQRLSVAETWVSSMRDQFAAMNAAIKNMEARLEIAQTRLSERIDQSDREVIKGLTEIRAEIRSLREHHNHDRDRDGDRRREG